MLTDEEEAELLIIDTLQSQKEFEGMNLNQVLTTTISVGMTLYSKYKIAPTFII